MSQRSCPLKEWVLVGLFGALVASTAQGGVPALSTFDADQDGWLVVELPYPTAGPPYSVLNTQIPTWVATGGNPGGFIQNSTAQSHANSVVYWGAPGKFLGDVSAAYGGSLSFDLFDTPATNQFNQEDLILTGGGKTVVFDTSNPGPTWTHYSVGLTQVGWRLNNLSGAAASQADMLTVLGNLTSLYIRGEFQLGNDTRGIDNVALRPKPAIAPTVTTTAVTAITAATATSGGTVTSDGGAAVTARGVCWGTSANPTLTDSFTVDGTGTGGFTSSITGLLPETPYHLRAYATNEAGTGYGDDLTFTTSLAGDVNGDGCVDVVDLLWLVDAFGSVAGDPNYNPAADFNADGSVDVVDLLDMVFNFGECL
jgi:hypothetical protein